MGASRNRGDKPACFRMAAPASTKGAWLVVSGKTSRSSRERDIPWGSRAVSQAAQRVQEAKKLGFTTVILPEVCREQIGEIKGVRLCGVRTVAEAVEVIS